MDENTSFGSWLRRRRKMLDITQAELAQQVGCVAGTIKSIEADLRRPSKHLAARLAQALALESDMLATFLKVARAELAAWHLHPIQSTKPATREPGAAPRPPCAPASAASDACFIRHQLRAPVSDFQGRTAELTHFLALLDRMMARGAGAAVIGVQGMGGIGKTEFAHAVAAHCHTLYPDGQLLLDLRDVSHTSLTGVQALQQVIQAFRPEEQVSEDLAALQSRYCSLLAGKRVLLIADDAQDAAQVRLLLPPVGSALLITSRQRFTLDGMAVLSLEQLSEAVAVQLLQGICERLTEEQAWRIAVLCGGLPLALRISGGILGVFA